LRGFPASKASLFARRKEAPAYTTVLRAFGSSIDSRGTDAFLGTDRISGLRGKMFFVLEGQFFLRGRELSSFLLLVSFFFFFFFGGFFFRVVLEGFPFFREMGPFLLRC